MGNCFFLPAQGWEIDQQERKKLQIPRGMPGGGGGGGAWLNVKFNQALLLHFSVAPAGGSWGYAIH